MNPQSYYEVSGERVIFKEGIKPPVSRAPRAIRLQTLDLKEAEAFASRVYRREKILLEIHEIDRRPA